MMQRIHSVSIPTKWLAGALATALLVTAVPNGLFVRTPAQAELLRSVADFSRAITQMNQPDIPAEPFASLHYDAQRGILQKDGVVVGTSYAGFAVEDGTITVASELLALPAGDGNGSLDTATRAMGCTVQEDEDGVTITSPFQSARLIVKAAGAVDARNAIAVTEGFRDLHVLQYATPADAYAAYQAYQAMDTVTYVEPSRTVRLLEASDQDPSVEQSSPLTTRTLWGVDAIGAWAYNETIRKMADYIPDVTVAVIDTGIYAAHHWFQDRIVEGGVSFLPGDDGIPDDLHGHGTHCAGIICSSTLNNVKILPVQVLDAEGYGETIGVYCGMLYALEQGADVLSISIGMDGESPLFNEAAKAVAAQDVPACVAAGNDSWDVSHTAPANCPDVIAVSAITEERTLCYFSNYGDMIDFAAPGDNIPSAGLDDPDTTVLKSGTSMAAPHVAACCAMLLSFDTKLSVNTIVSYLKANADDLGQSGFDPSFGWGMVQMKDFQFTDHYCDKPMASVSSGTYEEAFDLTLSVMSPDATIYYTLDGTTPNQTDGLLYDGNALSITHSTLLQAIAYQGDAVSDVLQELYALRGEEVVAPYLVEDGVLLAYRGVLQSVDLDAAFPDGSLQAIGEKAFQANDTLVAVKLPDSVQSIGDRAFAGCSALQSVSGFGVTAIGEFAFAKCGQLTSVSTAELESLGKGAFSYCQSLAVLLGTDSLTTIPNQAFEGCEALSTIALKAVTVVGAQAFDKCLALCPLSLQWEQITRVGDYAFQGCGSLMLDVNLSNVESLGDYAFAESGIRSLTLPAARTNLPNGLLYYCNALASISAPGLTVLGDYALALSTFDTGADLTSDIPYESLQVIGSYAFMGFHFSKPVTFSSVQKIGTMAFSIASGRALSFPTIRELSSPQLDSVMVDAIYLENVETIAKGALSYLNLPIVLGDACTKIAEGAIGSCAVLAAPPNSVAETYATTHHLPFQATPSVYAPLTDVTIGQYCALRLSAIPLGFSLQTSWSQLDQEGMQDALPTPVDTYYYDVPSSAPMLVAYRCTVSTQQGAVVAAADFSVTRTPQEMLATLTEDVPVWQDWDALYPAWSSVVRQSQMEEQYFFYAFTPTRSGVYYAYMSGGSYGVSSTFCDADGKILPQLAIPNWTQGIGHAIYLTAGESYLVRLGSGYSDIPETISTLTVSQMNPCTKQAMQNLLFSAEQAIYEEPVFPVIPTITVRNADTELVEGRDYTLWYYHNDRPGIFSVYAFGMGAYVGRSEAYQVVLADCITAEQPMSVTIPYQQTYEICFTPTADGDYQIIPSVDEELLATALANDDVDALNAVSPTLELIDPAWNFLGVSTGLRSTISVSLEAGTRYTLRCSADDTCTFALLITQKRQALSSGFAWFQDEYTVYTGERQYPKVIVTTDADETLTPSVDYTLYYFHNQRVGELWVYAIGKGAYYGVQAFSGEIRLCAAPTDPIPMTLGTPVTVTRADSIYELTLTEETLCRLTVTSTQTVCGVFHCVLKETNTMEVAYTFAVNDSKAETLTLPAGTYYITLQPIAVDSVSLTVDIIGDLFNASIAADPIPYTGAAVQPIVTVRDEDKVLVEGSDYQLYCNKSARLPGLYTGTLKGINDYIGESSFQYEITMPPLPEELPELECGTQSVTLSTPMAYQMYRISALKEGSYCISNQQLQNVYMGVFTSDCHLLQMTSGNGKQLLTISVTPDVPLYLMVAYDGAQITGTVSITVQDDFVPFEACMVEAPQSVPYTGAATIPSFTVTFEGMSLQEGVDYRVFTTGNTTGPGTAVIELEGMGRCCGTLSFQYEIYYEQLNQVMADEGWRATPLTLGESLPITVTVPGQMHLLSFTSPMEETAVFLVQEAPSGLVQVYRGDGSPDEMELTEESTFALEPNETIYFLVIQPSMGIDFSDLSESICITERGEICTAEIEGVTYQFDGDEVYVIAIDPWLTMIPMMDYLQHPLTGKTLLLTGFTDEVMADVIHARKILLCEQESMTACLAPCYGMISFFTDATSTVTGDFTGNGTVTASDAIALQYWLTETDGTQALSDRITYADWNADGIVDLLDLFGAQSVAEPEAWEEINDAGSNLPPASNPESWH